MKENQLLRDLNVVVQAGGGKQVVIDTTVVSALTGRGVARGHRQGQAIHEAEQDKRRRYPELLTGTRCHFLVMASEVAGRWSPRAVMFSVQRAYAASLLGKPLGAAACVNGPAVHVGDLDRLPGM